MACNGFVPYYANAIPNLFGYKCLNVFLSRLFACLVLIIQGHM